MCTTQGLSEARYDFTLLELIEGTIDYLDLTRLDLTYLGSIWLDFS